ncbi:hypothetical protein KQX54_011620 [Cotesia glomerata]|uniref:Uncharacterized protein n=1 Tax=Cotesia glomerata TaxID=32391 RepID=A0AAV7IYT8_COTGL|nr:hypothetical protein KQX54_011620 [Cotesia glomerata]
MFLVQSYDDQKAYIVDHNDIECIGKQVHEIIVGDEVLFKLGKKEFEGKVIDHSSNSKYLRMELTTFNKAIEGTKKKSNDAKVLGSKRKHVPKRSWSPSNSTSPKKSKKMDTKMEKKSGRNKDLLKPKPAKKLIDSSPSSSDSSHISESDGDEKTSTTPPQSTKKLNDSNKSKATDDSGKTEENNENKVSPEILPECDDAEEKANSVDLFPPEFDGGKVLIILYFA